jgi:tetratricopeptide (TPR) repeat protein
MNTCHFPAGGTSMFRKYLFLTSLVMALWASSAIVASAQLGELHGHVNLKGADGKTVPAPGAMIDVFRVDMNSGKYEQKADKKGEFRWAGLPLVGTYVISVSLANAQPAYLDQVKVGRDVDYELVVTAPGDGRRFTFDELKTVMKGSGPVATGTGKKGESADEKAEREKIEAKNREITEKNKRADDSNKILGEKFKLGNASLTAAQAASRATKYDEAEKLYTDAIAQYDEGLAADPTHPGIPALLTNKGQALVDRGIERYNSTILSEPYKAANKTDATAALAMLEPAKKDWKDAAESATKAVDWYKKESASTDASETANRERGKYFALLVRSLAMSKVVAKVDPTQADAGVTAYSEYIAVETDAAKKAKAERDSAQMLFDAGMFDKALVAFQKVLETNPDDADALLKSGLCLFNIGAINADKTKYQEAANYLQRYIDKAPDTDQASAQNKIDAKDIIENLKANENVKPEKITAPPRKKRP